MGRSAGSVRQGAVGRRVFMACSSLLLLVAWDAASRRRGSPRRNGRVTSTVPGPDELAAWRPDASARCGGEQVVAARRCELSSDDRVQLHLVLLVAATRAGRSPTRWNAWLCGGCCTAVAPTDLD